MNINHILKKIENNQYNIQYVFNCCRITIEQLKNSNKICNIYNFISYLILNLDNSKKLLSKFKLYYTSFDWDFTVEQIIVYSILTFYDLKNINITEQKFLIKLKKEMKLYSTYNAQKRLENLMDSKRIDLES